MTRGAVIFAHNSREVDYSLLSMIAGGLAKKHLKVPVSLIVDEFTVDWMQTSNTFKKAADIFDQIIVVSKPKTDNTRRLNDGDSNSIVPFVNTNRDSVWDLTPYDRTLLLDSDFLIFSNALSEYWDVDEDILISKSMNDFCDRSRAGYHDRYISDTGIHMFWATTVMFTKNERTRSFFDMVQFVKENYEFYADVFRFSPQQFRNDIAFSVAKHILDGFETETKITLPPILTTLDKDILHSVDASGKLTMLITPKMDNNYCAASIDNTDLHIMNKQSIIRNAESLLNLI
jgi:hypothetical protein